MLAVQNPPWESLVIFDKAWDVREPRNVVVASSHYQRIEPLPPPIVLPGPFLPQRQDPFVTLLHGPLDRRSEFQQLVISILHEEVLDPAPDRLSVSKRSASSVRLQGPVRQLVWEGLLREAHDRRDDIAVQVLMQGRV